MIKNFNALAERLKGVKVGDKDLTSELLKDIISKEEEIELIIPKINIYTDEQIEGMKTSVREEQKTQSYTEGKDAGREMFIKELKKKAGIEGTEGKTVDTVYKHLYDKLNDDLNKEPNEKITELTQSVANLQKTIESKNGEIERINGEKLAFEKQTRVKAAKMKNIPDNLSGIKPEHFLAAADVEGISLDFDDNNNEIAIRNGKPVKDQMEKYIPVKDVYTEFAEKNKWIGKGKGAGGGDYNPGDGNKTFKSMNDIFKYMKENNINPFSKEGQKLQDEFSAKTQAAE